MKTFYSILSAVINPVTSEKVSLGLLLSNGNKSLFDYSNNRLHIIKSLVSNDHFFFIKNYLKSIDKIIAKIDKNQIQQTMYNTEGKNILINEPYIDYLSVYNQNIISFSKSVQIDIQIENEVFKNLYLKFIDNDIVIPEHKLHNVQRVKELFTPKVKDYFTIEKELTTEDYSDLMLPVTIDLFGKNERTVFGQFFDLEKKLYHIKNDYFDLLKITELFSDSEKFLVSAEPDKTIYTQQHNFWEQIRTDKKYHHLDVSEVEKIEEYAKKHGVVPV